MLQLGGRIDVEYTEATHLVMDKPFKSPSLLCCLSTVSQIVNQNWLINSNTANNFLGKYLNFKSKNLDYIYNI